MLVEAEKPLTAEPTMGESAPLTSEPPLAAEPPLTSEPSVAGFGSAVSEMPSEMSDELSFEMWPVM